MTNAKIFTDELDLRGDSDVLWDVYDAEDIRVGRLHYCEEEREYTAETIDPETKMVGRMLSSFPRKREALDALCHAVNHDREADLTNG